MLLRILILPALVALLFAGAAVPVPAAAMDADQLIARHLEAAGGLERIRAVRTERITGTYLTEGLEIPFTLTVARPGRLRLEATIMGVSTVQVRDGDQAWAVVPLSGSSAPEPLDPHLVRRLEALAEPDGIFLDWRDKGYRAEYRGEGEVRGIPAYRLHVDLGGGTSTEFWFGQESFLVLKQTTIRQTPDGPLETDSYPAGYRDVDGLVTPFTVESRRNDGVTTRVSVIAVEYGVPVDEGFFARPGAPAAPRR